MSGPRVAIVGCGKMGREHARAARALGAEVTWACDADLGKAMALASGGRCTAVADASRIDWGAIDAVFVCTPPSARGPVERCAIEARVPFFVEKPIGLSAGHAAGLVRALRERPVVHSVGYMSRYRRSVQWARARMSGARLLGATCAWVGKIYGRPWWLDARRSGGPFNEQATHLVDLCRHVGAEIVDVAALGARSLPQAGAEDTLAAALGLEGGGCATVLYSCLGAGKEISVELFSTAGPIRLEGWDLRLDDRDEEGGDGEPEDVFALEAAAFFAAIESNDQGMVLCDLEDALKTQRAVDAIMRSVRSGRAERVAVAGA